MSLNVHLTSVQGFKGRQERLAKINFRGNIQTTATVENYGNEAVWDEVFEWPMGTGITNTELLEVTIFTKGKLRAPKLVGSLNLVLQQVVENGHLTVEEALLDSNNVPTDIIINIDIKYQPPEGAFTDWMEENFSIRKEGSKEALLGDAEDWQLGRPMTTSSTSGFLTPTLSHKDLKGSKRSLASGGTTRSIKGMMKFGTRRRKKGDNLGNQFHMDGLDKELVEYHLRRISERGSFQELDALSVGYDQLDPDSDTGSKKDDTDSDIVSQMDMLMTLPAYKKVGPIGEEDINYKEQDYQVTINVHEARQLTGLDIDPVVIVQVGDKKKSTTVKESTNNPYFNELFVFDFHEPTAMVFDKIIQITALHSRNILSSGTVIGTFKFDVGTVYQAHDHCFMKKWAILIDPSDINGGPKGYVKLDISVVGKGDGVKPTKSGADEDDDIESNLLLPENTPSVRPRANFSVRIYKAEGLPIMNAGIVSGVKKIFTGDVKDLVDPYVQVWFGGQTGKTSVKKNRYDPEWNEQVVFSEMFPPLCRRIKLQLKDKDSVVGDVIGTSFIDLAKISNDGNEGFEPTFGPSWINLYGSTRQYNTVDANRKLNEGFGRGCMFRGRLLVALKTDIQDSTLESGGICVTNESCLPISETAAGRKEEFFLFGTIFAASMIDASVGDKPILFEFSIGNFGNQVDGRNVHVGRGGGADSDESDEESGLLGHEHSDVSPEVSMPMTPPMAPRLTNDKNYYYLPIDTVKPNIFIKFPAEESRRRLYNRNILHRIAKKLEEGVVDVSERLSKEKPNTEKTFRNVLQDFIYSCQNYSKLTKGTGGGSGAGKTKLDKERQKWLAKEMEELAKMAKEQNKGKKWTNKMIREKMKAVRGFLSRVKFLADEPQDSIPDVFLWMIAGGKRVAFARIPAEKLIYSVVDEENGERCGQMQTVFLRLPGKKGETAEGWAIQAKLELYLWLGMNKHRKEMIKKLPKGYDMTADLKNCVKPTFLPPPAISYNVTNTYQMRCHIYQARSLVGSDSSGLSDPFARVVVMDQSKQTKTIEETLSPTWDEVLILDNVTIHGDREDLKDNPPLIAIEVFDVDVGSGSEFIGRTLIRPVIKLTSEPYEKPYFPPMLQWHHVYRGTSQAGELLAAVEMIQLHRGDLPADVLTIDIPQPDPLAKKKKDQLPPPVPIPDVIKPKMCKYRIEILCWGMREVKRLQLMTVDKPRVDIECGGATISSAIIPNAQKNPNFPDNVRVMDVELPESEFYCPPLTFRVVDCRQFGRFTLVGTHVVNSLSHFKLTNVKDVEEKRGKRSNKGSHESMNVRGAPALEDSSRDSIATDTVAQLEPSNQNEGFELNGAEPNPEPPTSNGDVVITMADPKPPNGNVPKDSGSGVPSEAGDKQPAAPGAEGQPGKPDGKDEKKKKKSDDEENTLDWWSRYYATVATMQKEQAENPTIEIASDDHDGEGGAMKDTQEMAITPVTRDDASKDKKEKKEKSKGGGGGMMKKMKKSGDDDSIDMTMFEALADKNKKEDYSDICKLQIYPNELESVPEFHGFKEWLHTFDILRGKNTGDEDSESRVVGKFKGSLKLYKWPLPKEWDARKLFGGDPVLGFFQGLPLSEPIGVLVRVYIVKANDLHPTDVGGKADPYVFTQLGKQKQNDKENYISKNLNPVFGKCFEFEATFPMESRLVVQIYDWDLIGSDDLIGETVIDLENRFYSKHRATCGFCSDYATFGYNNWRDPQKPSMILKQLCKDNKLDPPAYSRGKVVVNGVTFLGEEFVEDEGGTKKPTDEHVALEALKHWHEIPGTGARKIVPEHVETRPLYSPEKPGIEQGRVEMWVDMFPMDMPLPGAPIDISPRKPKKYELRVIIWNTDEVVLADDAFLTGEKMSDIFVKGWLNGPNDDQQSTDIHYRSLTGEGNFNWRFIYQFEYLAAEEKMVIRKKESTFSVDETEYKVPPRLMLQVWDADSFSADDFLGSCTLDLNRFPRGAKTSKKCTPDILKMDGTVPLMNLFKLKRHKGWWPFMAQSEHEEEELTGKVEAEMHLMTEEEAEKSPAGLARDEPDPLEKPNRPDTSFIWFLNPWKSFRYIICVRLKWLLIKLAILIVFVAFFALFIYNLPGYAAERIVNIG